MMTGICVDPPPKGLVAYWGYGDVDGAWYTKPSEHYRKLPLVSRAEAYQAVGGKVLTGTTPANQGSRGRYYLYLRQNGLWTREVTGFDPEREAIRLNPYCPVRNITALYPPILMIHGTRDRDVPCQKSRDMAEELARHGVRHELITVEGGGHGLGGGDPEDISRARARALAFIRNYLGSPAQPPRK
jgi:acetyl esterase/lipase